MGGNCSGAAGRWIIRISDDGAFAGECYFRYDYRADLTGKKFNTEGTVVFSRGMSLRYIHLRISLTSFEVESWSCPELCCESWIFESRG